MKKRLFVSMIFSAMVWSMTACGSKTVNVEETHEVIPTEAVEQEMETQEAAVQEETTEEVAIPEVELPQVSYDNSDLESMMTALDSQTQNAITAVEEKTTEVSTLLGETYESFDANKGAITEYYAYVAGVSYAFYDFIDTLAMDYYKCVASNGVNDFDVWNDAMDDFDRKVERSLFLFVDAEEESQDDVWELSMNLISMSDDRGNVFNDYSSVNIDAQAAITDRNTSFETSFGEVYTAVSEGFEAGETDVETILGIEKIQQDEVDEEVEEGNEKATAAPENVRPELVEFFEAYDEFADDYCAFLEKYYGASDNSDMESENEEMTKKNDNFNIEIRSWMDVDMTSEESDYYYNECMRIREKIAAGMEKAIELRDSK